MVDAKHIMQHLDEKKPEGVENESVEQLAFADRILMNKMDLVPDPIRQEKIEARIKSINKTAQNLRPHGYELSLLLALRFLSNHGLFDLCRHRTEDIQMSAVKSGSPATAQPQRLQPVSRSGDSRAQSLGLK